MKKISMLLVAMMVFMVGFTGRNTGTNEVILTASQVTSAADIENAINAATEYGTQPGIVTLDSSHGDFFYTGDDLTIDIHVSNITLRSENGAVIRNCENGVFLDSSIANEITIGGVTFYCQLSGVLAWGGHENVTVKNNTFHGFASGVYVFQGKDWTITGNQVIATPTSNFPEASGASVHILQSNNIEVSANKLTAGVGVNLWESENIKVVRNEIYAVWYGITLGSSASRNQIRFNHIWSAQEAGILFQGGNEHNKVFRNTVQCTWSYDCLLYYADVTYTPLSRTNKIIGNKLIPADESNTFTTIILPGFWSVFNLGPVSDGTVHFVDVTPLHNSLDGAHIPSIIVPQYDGEQWVDVLRVMVPVSAPPEQVQITVYELGGLPTVLDVTDSFYPAVQRSYPIAPASNPSMAYFADLDPLDPSIEGMTLENYLIHPEFVEGQWTDALFLQTPYNLQPDPLNIRLRVHAADSLPLISEFNVLLTKIDTWSGFLVGPSWLERGYVVRISPVNGDPEARLEYYRIQPEFNGYEWYDVLRLQMGNLNGDWESMEFNIKVYGCDEGDCP